LAGALNQNQSVLKRVWFLICPRTRSNALKADLGLSLFGFDLTISEGYRYKRLFDSQTPFLPRLQWPINTR
ncbi:MAG: hypothetical protein PVG69_11570, partial [Desulfobacterales bacterium]